jgi:hypothetical protein
LVRFFHVHELLSEKLLLFNCSLLVVLFSLPLVQVSLALEILFLGLV